MFLYGIDLISEGLFYLNQDFGKQSEEGGLAKLKNLLHGGGVVFFSYHLKVENDLF